MNVFNTLQPEQRKNLILLFVLGILSWASHSSLIATLPLYIKDIGGTPQQIGFVMGAFALGVILTRPWLGKLADRYSRKLVVMIGLAIATISPLGYFINSILILFWIRAFHGISIAAYSQSLRHSLRFATGLARDSYALDEK
ncbi:MFS transporter [Scytonema sp. NUACC26]|uniref:MFS transporter n=1 Tax=Scytonema sp. NUACC26 TaxID=3140176 RepID=UPI0034DC78AF